MNKLLLIIAVTLTLFSVSAAQSLPAATAQRVQPIHSGKPVGSATVCNNPRVRKGAPSPFAPALSTPLLQSVARVPQFAAGTLQANLLGVVIYDSELEKVAYGYHGLYEVDVNSPAPFSALFTNSSISFGAFVADGKLYCPHLDTLSGLVTGAGMNVFDMQTGLLLEEIEQMQTRFEILTATYVPAISKAVCFVNDLQTRKGALVALDLNGQFTELKQLPDMDFYGGLTIADSALLGLSESGALYRINTSDWSASLVADTGIAGYYASALGYDENNNVIYTTNSPADGQCSFFTINPSTGEATKRFDWGRTVEFGLLYSPTIYTDKAPAAPSGITADFPQGSLQGNLSFTAPSTTFDGMPADGSFNYSILAYGSEVATGTATYGQGKVAVPLTLPRAGTVTFEVTLSNEAGKSPASRLTTYAGPDICAPLTGLSLTYSEGAFRLSWDEPTGMNGGYLNPAQVAYRIERTTAAGTAVVATAATGTAYADTYPLTPGSPEWAYYSVTPTYEGQSSPATESAKYVAGEAALPFSADLSDVNSANLLTVVDANADGSTWRYTLSEGIGIFAYNYSKQNAADDYLILPAAHLQKGKLYFLTFQAGCAGSYTERIAAYAGTAPGPEAMTEVILQPTDIDVPATIADGQPAGREFTCRFSPEADGTYYFAIRACSDADKNRLGVFDIHLSAATGYDAPAAPTDLSLTPDADGGESVTMKFRAPALTIGGNPLAALSRVEIYRDGILAATLKPAIGAEVTYVDTATGSGVHHYEVVPFNAEGRGLSAKGSVYAGLSVPAPVENASLTPGDDYGMVNLSWSPVTKDINGKNLKKVTYTVAVYDSGQWTPAATGITATKAQVRICAADATQSFAQIAIFAVNEQGSGEGYNPGLIPVGKPYSMPFCESFTFSTIIGQSVSGNSAKWSPCTDASYADISSQDADGAFLAFIGENTNDSGRIFTGRILLDDSQTNPTAIFYYYCFRKDDRNTLQLLVNDGSGFKKAGNPVTIGTGIAGSWNRVAVPLSKYKGQALQLALDATCANFSEIIIDNLRLENLFDHDAAVDLAVPATVEAGKPMTATAIATNNGSATLESYSVDLIVDDAVVARASGTNLRSGASAPHTFTFTVPELSAETLSVWARINVGADSDWSNNATPRQQVYVLLPDFPAVIDLKAEGADGSVTLSWSTPDYSNYQAPVTDSFEAYDSFATMRGGFTGDWTFLDRDGHFIGSINGVDLPNVPFNERQSFFVLDNSISAIRDCSYPASFGCHSGNQCLAALYNYNLAQCDDWAISPELNGAAQFISFYARSYSSEYPETLEVLYSSTDREPESFKSVATFPGISTDADFGWTRYEFRVPQGARYFAIRFISADTFMVMVDDVTYTGKESSPLTLLGYNVYCDGVKLNTTPLQTATFTHTPAAEKPVYHVTALYEAGESRASNAVYPYGSGLSEILTGLRVSGLHGAIAIEGAAGPVQITDAQGRVIHRGGGGHIPAAPGAYIVTCGRTVVKVIVK